MVRRALVEKRASLDLEARKVKSEAERFLGIRTLNRVRLVLLYDVEGLDAEGFDRVCRTILSEPQLDILLDRLPEDADFRLCVEALPGQFDQRADSAAQCVQMMTQQDRPRVRCMKIWLFYGALTEAERDRLRKHLINPVESREGDPREVDTLESRFPVPEAVKVLTGFTEAGREELERTRARLGLAMDTGDLLFCQNYFRNEQRDPTMTEIRVIDTYWSDHCRHTTFLTRIDDVSFEDAEVEKAWEDYLHVRESTGDRKDICLMDVATLGMRFLRQAGKLDRLDESEEINACTVRMDLQVDGRTEPWLLLFTNETHNHPTEIEPFGGAATCIGGAIRDPLSGRAYVYAAMRLTGAASPLTPLEDTVKGRLPQRRICQGAAAGYSSYGNQIGLATGLVDEIYHPGFAAKRMEIGAVIGAVPESHVRRSCPEPGDVVILMGGSTGRDGCGGATGSSQAHDAHSLESCGAEVQKGNAPEERKLQRLMRRGEASRMIRRCNDFGAGGVSVAIGELADGLEVDLDRVPRKYEGLDGTELAISESQERMAVVVRPQDAEAFLALCREENLQACVVARVTEEKRLVMHWRDQTVVNLSREFLASNGAPRHIRVRTRGEEAFHRSLPERFDEGLKALSGDLNVCSHRGLAEQFDATIGAGTVLMPFGGRHQLSPMQAMVQKVSLEEGHTQDCSFMAWGYSPFRMEKAPFRGAYLSVVESVSKLIAAGADRQDMYLTLQEYFPHPGRDEKRWGDPLAALLGAFEAQKDLGIAAIGGKDSMSGSFEHLDVPPTLVSFAVTTGTADQVVSGEWKRGGHQLVLLRVKKDDRGLPEKSALLDMMDHVTRSLRSGRAVACGVPCFGGVAGLCMQMAFGNGVGMEFRPQVSMETLFDDMPGAFVMEVTQALPGEEILGDTLEEPVIRRGSEEVTLAELLGTWEEVLEDVYPLKAGEEEEVPTLNSTARAPAAPHVSVPRPRLLIPVFPGTNCEYDSLRAAEDQGFEGEVLVIRNLSGEDVRRSSERFAEAVARSEAVFLPGGFSGGDEPDGSGKFITAFLRGAGPREAISDLLDRRGGLMLGICNGFQALIKLGLVPYGRILDTDENCPTLTFNTIARHQSRLVRTRVCSTLSPWLQGVHVGDIFTVPVSHGEGRFLAGEESLRKLVEKGQIATQYVNLDGKATLDIHFNPNGSLLAVEGLTSPDGRVLGKMGHSERIGPGLYRNVPGETDMQLFRAGVSYFRIMN